MHGPKPRSHAIKCNKKVRRLGLKIALTARAAEGKACLCPSSFNFTWMHLWKRLRSFFGGVYPVWILFIVKCGTALDWICCTASQLIYWPGFLWEMLTCLWSSSSFIIMLFILVIFPLLNVASIPSVNYLFVIIVFLYHYASGRDASSFVIIIYILTRLFTLCTAFGTSYVASMSSLKLLWLALNIKTFA